MPDKIQVAVFALIGARWLAQLWLAALNRRHVQRYAARPPVSQAGIMDDQTYARSVAYTLARNRLHQADVSWDALVLSFVLISGVFPQSYLIVSQRLGSSAWAGAAFLFVVGLVLSLASLPLEWFAQFRVEARFGFNTTTLRTWITDRLKAFALSAVLGYPLLVLILHGVEWSGPWWWLVAWVVVMGFQLLMMVLAPALTLPLFNRFTPLPDGALKERLLGLARRTGFHAASIQVMDGSRRSRHSNAFFTGLGRLRKIVLFDTLLAQLSDPELEAVLAHEIGHDRRRHIRKMMLGSSVALLAAFYAAALVSRYPEIPLAFGFERGGIVPTLTLLGLVAGTVTFWATPLIHRWSRRFEYEADRFAAEVMHESTSLIGALRKLTEKNLANLTPHPAYSGFYYSHPTLAEREQHLLARELQPTHRGQDAPGG